MKDEYDKAATTLAKATESSVNQHARRKGVNGEIKQYKDMKKEAERWTTVGLEKVRFHRALPCLLELMSIL